MHNVYDFDKTVIYPDSGVAFFFFCLRRHFFRVLPYVPETIAELLRFASDCKNERPPKGDFYLFLPALPDWREDVRLFWQKKADKLLKPWYLKQKRPDDIIISCTADFLLQPICSQLGVRLAATHVNTETGRIEGAACYGEEKVRFLQEAFGQVEIGDFHSDSRSDVYLARLAQRAFLVKGDTVLPWPQES